MILINFILNLNGQHLGYIWFVFGSYLGCHRL
jgi:hypothetical protein